METINTIPAKKGTAAQPASPETPDEDIQENESMLYAKYTS